MAGVLVGKLAESLFDWVFSIGAEKGVNSFQDKQNEKELKAAIQDYLEQFYKEKFFYLSLDEEFDFGGFKEFLFRRKERLEEYFYCSGGKRDAVLEALQHEALACANPRGQSGQRLVLNCLDAVLNVIENILMKRVDPRDLFMSSRTAEQIQQAVEKIAEEQAESIHRHMDYRGSFAELVDQAETKQPDDYRVYHYTNSKIEFFGREEELHNLDAFLDDEKPFLYTVITGPGGIGKSKLLYHYVTINELDRTWKMLYPSRATIEGLCERRGEFFYPKNLLIVVDYVGQYPEKIGDWMEKIIGSKEKPGKMRLVLLERPSPEQGIKPEWYKKMVDRWKGMETYLWQERFYEMKLMGREELLALMDNIAGQKNQTLTAQNRQDIYERVCSFHHMGEGGSPLYTILTTDAFLDGKPLTSLDTNKLMEYVLERDETHWRDTICGGDGKLYRCFREMLIYATATGGWTFTPVGEPLSGEAECLRKISQLGKKAVCAKFPQIVTGNEKGNPVLTPLEPDLIGEYFVLNFLRDQMADERYQGRIRLFWEKTWPYAYFLNRCVDSYLYQQEFQELLDGEKTVFWVRKGNEEAAYLSAQLMVNLIAAQNAINGSKSVERLRKLFEEYSENKKSVLLFALQFAQGLFNLSNQQELSDRKASVESLGKLSAQYAGNEEIALVCAQGLTNLIIKQNVNVIDGTECVEQNAIDGTESVEQLKQLAQKFSKNTEILLCYAKILFLFCLKEHTEDTMILEWFQECNTFYTNWQTAPEAVQQEVSAKPDSNMKTLQLFLLEHTELFPDFMEWVIL